MQQYLTAIVRGVVSEIKTFGKLTIVKVKQGDYTAECRLGKDVPVPEVNATVKYRGTAKADHYNNEHGLVFWANEVLS